MSEKTFHIANFGCRASQSEGAAIQEELIDSGAKASTSAFDANVVVVNSCTVTEEADRDARHMIRRVAARNPEARIIVTGCYAQRAPEEIASLPGVQYVVGNSHKPLVGRLTLNVLDNDAAETGRAEIFCSDIFLEHDLKPRSHSGSAGRTRAVVKVQDGCNANCSFCIIPSVRGRSRSMDPGAVLAEVQSLVERGYKEVVLSGIHLGTYGRDLGARSSFGALIQRILAEIPGLERIRLSSIEPLEVTPEIIDLVAGEPRLAHHFHIPLQSGSRRILREMRRPYTADYYADLLHTIRSRVEDAAIGADVMVGFPGESDEEFFETYRLIENSPLTYLHVFPYSSRPGTPAAEMPAQVPAHVSQFRSKALRQLIAKKNESFRSGMIGRDLEVLVLSSGEAMSNNFIHVFPDEELSQNIWTFVRVTSLREEGLAAVRRPARARTD
ncbi:MAG TPA: tRNA (N(6)-L-threonylcarbamoyladenosine(37)-C(2))-methylthiotransferase MtaB [Terriglobia bacterium]|nr:tRNA (N(6)-L-threonylcarbamoyladenosine(37)-C(2))-methylthiotransferase MtaB [Terriglobia bacterium]